MWANINPQGGYNRPHVHPNSLYGLVSIMLKLQRIWKLVVMIQDQEYKLMMPVRKQGRPPKHLWRECTPRTYTRKNYNVSCLVMACS
jgi:hypothetical protein